MQIFYTVRPGDTIFQIASRWKLPYESLAAANNIQPPYMIYVGQQLSVPPGVNRVRGKSGDTIFSIAQTFGVPQSVIIQANQLQPPFTIQVGQLLNVPPGNPFYVVQSGDTLYQIANRYNVTTRGQSNYELIRQVNQLPNYDLSPGMRLRIPYAPPGNPGLIAYTSNRGGSYDIWVYSLVSGANVQLTTGLGESYSTPFWSPDSRKIAFVGRDGILFILNIRDGGISRIDQFTEGEGIFLDWSPDSQRLAYVKNNQIILYQVSTNQVQRIAAVNATDVQWFPNGRQLLYQAPDERGISQLYLIRTDGTDKQKITENTGGRLNNVRLSPDGSSVLYTSPGVSISIIYTIDLSSGQITEVKGGPLAKNYYPVWSLDSSTIAYSATAFEDVGYFSFIRTTGRKGENDRTRAISSCYATPVTWSPDGKKLGFLSGCNGEGVGREMWVMDLRHPVPIKLLEGIQISSLQWSPMPLSSLKRTYTNSTYNVQFEYPASWRRVNDERYEGPDGFFQVSTILSEETIQNVCQNEAFHQLLPYGTKPLIIQTNIQTQEACYIFPSEDQPPEMKGQAALIVRYPAPIQIGDTFYNYFILWADQNHLYGISSSLTFLR
ncbi:LysM peptidoglycan-binding domain-containing protein [Robertmurraya korlensis]|uniref:LysM peptidoglycan-binding domain-containing protein n=1 Tax=Robertmurraya korlensis TaxID=519977 RepID=UPI000824A673|nr:LysM peptidoglycan-binding domain-containing protein [Robertmurraya korlensis]